jgi:hypothetical protein
MRQPSDTEGVFIWQRRSTMRKLTAVCLALGLGLVPYALAAATYDGSMPLICALIEVMDCKPGADCQRGAPESVNLPQFIKLNFTEKTLSTTEAAQKQQSTPIKNIDQVDSSLILQGVEGSRAWSMVIAKETGKMSATVSDDQDGFVIFGACTPF